MKHENGDNLGKSLQILMGINHLPILCMENTQETLPVAVECSLTIFESTNRILARP